MMRIKMFLIFRKINPEIYDSICIWIEVVDFNRLIRNWYIGWLVTINISNKWLVLIDYVAKGKIRSLEIQFDGWRCMYAKIINRFPTPSFLKLFSHFIANSDATSFSPKLLRTSTTSIHHFIFITKRFAQVLDTVHTRNMKHKGMKHKGQYSKGKTWVSDLKNFRVLPVLIWKI